MNPIDRRALVERHAVSVGGVLPDSPLSVGNGEFAVTVDATGLQTFPDAYPLAEREGGSPGSLLGTMSQWAWHELPSSEPHHLRSTWRWYETPRGPVPYVDMQGTISGTAESGATAAESWLRANPHRLDLGSIGFVVADTPGARLRSPELAELDGIDQRLDLWQGAIRSRCRLAGDDVEVVTTCHPRRDAVAVRVRAGALVDGRLGIRLAFPYGSSSWNVATDWSRPDAHRSSLRPLDGGWLVERRLDATHHRLRIAAGPDAQLERVAPHAFELIGGRDVLEFVIEFLPGEDSGGDADELDELPDVASTLRAAADHWARFWTDGGAIDLDGSSDPRAPELERRIVLSQYLTAVNGAGSLPPQETGLMCNSWRGKFHLEMHWWHGAHFVLWDRPELLERSLGFYEGIADRARATASDQGLPGVRWPKQVGPDGRESPSPIGTFLVWQQPHPIYLAELLHRVRGDDALTRYGKLVLDTAAFMAALPVRTDRGYELAAPLVPAQESYADRRERVSNPTFELAYWSWALRTAQRWRERLGLGGDPLWDEVADGLVRPHVRDGVYSAIDVEPYTVREDHPSMVYALGMVPPTPIVEPDTMRRTLHDVLAEWDWSSTWGWDFPALAMTATRIGEPDAAIDTLLMDTPKNHYLANGHNRQTPTLPVYLPGNGGLLTAVAMMAAGFDGDGRPTPGFPDDGRWQVRHEGLHPMP